MRCRNQNGLGGPGAAAAGAARRWSEGCGPWAAIGSAATETACGCGTVTAAAWGRLGTVTAAAEVTTGRTRRRRFSRKIFGLKNHVS